MKIITATGLLETYIYKANISLPISDL